MDELNFNKELFFICNLQEPQSQNHIYIYVVGNHCPANEAEYLQTETDFLLPVRWDFNTKCLYPREVH